MLAKHTGLLARRLASTEIWVIAFFVALTVVSVQALPLALGVAVIYWGIRWVGHGHPSLRTVADWPIALLMSMAAVTLWITVLPDTTHQLVYRLVLGVALYYSIVNWGISQPRLHFLRIGIILGGLLLALLALVTVHWFNSGKLPFIPASLYARFAPRVSDVVNPNVMAGALVLLFPCALAVLAFDWHGSSWSMRVLTGTAVSAMFVVLILTQSRGGLMALAAVLLVMIMLRWSRGWLLLLGAMVSGAVTAQALGVGAVLNAFTSNSTFVGLEARREIWLHTLYIIQDFPFTGIGMGSFQTVMDLLYPLILTPFAIPHAHNLFLQVAVDLGIPGLIGWLAVLMLATIASWQLYRMGRARGDGWAAGFGAGLLCSQTALIVHGLTDAVTWGMVRTAVIVWALWGVSIAAWNVYVAPSNQLPGDDERSETSGRSGT